MCKALCDHLFQGIVSIIHNLLLSRGSMRYIRSLFNNLCMCFCMNVYFQLCGVYMHMHQSVWLPICACLFEFVSLIVCLTALYYITLNYNSGENVTACDLILNTSITFAQFQEKCACASVRVCNLTIPIKLNVTVLQTNTSDWKCDDLIKTQWCWLSSECSCPSAIWEVANRSVCGSLIVLNDRSITAKESIIINIKRPSGSTQTFTQSLSCCVIKAD